MILLFYLFLKYDGYLCYRLQWDGHALRYQADEFGALESHPGRAERVEPSGAEWRQFGIGMDAVRLRAWARSYNEPDMMNGAQREVETRLFLPAAGARPSMARWTYS
jgi:hypothetical protein